MADDTPIIVAESRRKAGLMAMGGGAFVLISSLMLNHPARSRDSTWFGIVFFGLCGLLGLAQVFWPATLTLDPSGFTLRQLWINRHRPWDRISNFRLWTPNPPRLVDWGLSLWLVAYDYAPAGSELKSGPRFATLPGIWTKSPAELLALMNECKAKWG